MSRICHIPIKCNLMDGIPMLCFLRINRAYLVKNTYRSYRTAQYVHGFRNDINDDKRSESHELLKTLYQKRRENGAAWQYINAFRNFGHKISQTNPLKCPDITRPEATIPELDPSLYFNANETSVKNLDCLLYNIPSSFNGEVSSLTEHLMKLYAGPISAEFNHIESAYEREWFAEHFESRQSHYPIDQISQIRYSQLLLKSQLFDKFLANKFTTVKRYSAEGAESMLVCFDEFFHRLAMHGVKNTVIGIPHRGRNNLLTVLLNYPPSLYFRKMKGKSEFPSDFADATGDTFSHFYQSTELQYPNCDDIHVSLIPNPSHLEANVSVAAGKTRSKMQTMKDFDYDDSTINSQEASRRGDTAACILVHGDASAVGQGIVAETLAMAYLPHFHIGGSIHLIVNNQLGFTTEAERYRSFSYSSDIGRTIGTPVVHVNGEDPEAVAQAAQLAVAYRQKFRRDIIIDLLCYRKWGHNELDDPSFTQPVMYNTINKFKGTPSTYYETLVSNGVKSTDITEDVDKFNDFLSQSLKSVDVEPPLLNFQQQWSTVESSLKKAGITVFNTGFPTDSLKEIGVQSVCLPENFSVHPTLKRSHVDKRIERIESGSGLDWATAEALSIGSLLKEGHNVRISGQDVGRGTFSHRHFMLVDQSTDDVAIPLNLGNFQGKLEVANSLLSEEAVLGFEIGMSMDNPNNLIIWEAQFGDFFNGAQIQFDTYVSSSEKKWLHQSGLIVLLPHGYDGAGPEHSSCRMERFLQMTDSSESSVDTDQVNMNIIFPTTPAQYFHALRRQIVRPFRKPLVVIAPKGLIRSPHAVSPLSELEPGTHFRNIINDSEINSPQQVKKVILCTGKHYYELNNYRKEKLSTEDANKTAIIRIEQLAPFPAIELSEILKTYSSAKHFIWAQEEHRNMGAWQFINPRIKNLLNIKLRYAGRKEGAAPAVGIGEKHRAEISDIMSQTFS